LNTVVIVTGNQLGIIIIIINFIGSWQTQLDNRKR